MTDDRMIDTIEALAATYMRRDATDATTKSGWLRLAYAEDAEFFSSEDGDLRLTGRRAIADNIGQVNGSIQGHGLHIVLTGTSLNHPGLARVAWQMLTPDGQLALTGMDVLVLNDDGRIAQDHIFIAA